MNYFTMLDVSADNLSLDYLKSVLEQFGTWAFGMIGNIILAIIVWLIGKRVIKWILSINRKALEKSSLDVSVGKFVGTALKFVLYVVLLFMVIDILGFQTTSLLTIFGSGALAVGMSLQGSLSNFAGGILLLVFKPFKVGDYISCQEKEGSVVSIELLYTRLRTVDNKVIFIPNGTLSNCCITNVGTEGVRRLDTEVGISYGEDISKAKKVMEDTINSIPEIIQDKGFEVIVKSLDESCVVLESHVWVAHANYVKIKFKLLENIKIEFDKNGIEFPFNQLDVHMVK